jgi:hypothetical protein
MLFITNKSQWMYNLILRIYICTKNTHKLISVGYRRKQGVDSAWTEEETITLLTMCREARVFGGVIKWPIIENRMMEYGIYKTAVYCSYKYYNLKAYHKKYAGTNHGRHRYSQTYWLAMDNCFGSHLFRL